MREHWDCVFAYREGHIYIFSDIDRKMSDYSVRKASRAQCVCVSAYALSDVCLKRVEIIMQSLPYRACVPVRLLSRISVQEHNCQVNAKFLSASLQSCEILVT